MRPATESFRDVSAYGIHRIVGLRSKFEIALKCGPLGQREYLDPHLVGQLPDDQIGVMTRTSHANSSRTRDASEQPQDSQGLKDDREETANTAAAIVRRNCTD